jgi:Protein of unknown function (DUF935)
MRLDQLPLIAKDATQPAPSDPLEGADHTKIVFRQIPNVTVSHGWNLEGVRRALIEHQQGLFEMSAQLVDSIFGNARIQATLGSRTSGLFGQETRFKAANKSSAAKECLDAWVSCWPRLGTDVALTTVNAYEIMMGWHPSQLLWDTAGPIWEPSLQPWHQRFTYYNWGDFQFKAISADGIVPITPGDGKWVLHARKGFGINARPWIFGTVRGVAQPWMYRNFAERDLARLSEVHGMPIRLGMFPAGADEVQRDRFAQQLANLGSETTIMLQKGADGAGQDYGAALLEAEHGNYEVMIALRDSADMEIILAIVFQNMTTEVKGGSFAAATAVGDILQRGIQGDNKAWRHTIREQIAKPFASINFGDADLAPWTDWDVQPVGDWAMRANMLTQFSTAIDTFRRGGVQFTDRQIQKLARSVGLKLPRPKIVTPVQMSVAAITADAKAKEP